VATNIVEAQGITKAFGKTQVLKGIDLTVPQGTVLALLGPNGAGKTTIVRILTTLLKPDSGTVTIAGYDASGRVHQAGSWRGEQVGEQHDLIRPGGAVQPHCVARQCHHPLLGAVEDHDVS
jgi:ABC-type branched-subunit amino acid transport system ATPase component